MVCADCDGGDVGQEAGDDRPNGGHQARRPADMRTRGSVSEVLTARGEGQARRTPRTRR